MLFTICKVNADYDVFSSQQFVRIIKICCSILTDMVYFCHDFFLLPSLQQRALFTQWVITNQILPYAARSKWFWLYVCWQQRITSVLLNNKTENMFVSAVQSKTICKKTNRKRGNQNFKKSKRATFLKPMIILSTQNKTW